MFLHFLLVLCAKNIAKRDFFRKYNIFLTDEVNHLIFVFQVFKYPLLNGLLPNFA